MFRFEDPEPPSTPNRHRRQSRNGPSTTPAGPPPDQSLLVSSTPAEPPPRTNSLFGTSRPTFDQPTTYSYSESFFASSPPKHGLFEGVGSGSIGTSSSGRPAVPRPRPASAMTTGGGGGGFQVPDTSSDDGLNKDAEGESIDEGDDDDAEYDEESDEHDYTDDDEPRELQDGQQRTKPQNQSSQSAVSRASTTHVEPGSTLVRASARQRKFDLKALAKGLTASSEGALWQESDHTILETERLIVQAHDSIHSGSAETRAHVLSATAQDLSSLWQASSKTASKVSMSSSRSDGHNGLTDATRLADLLLAIHYPPPLQQTLRNSALALIPAKSETKAFTPIPKVLLDWLNNTYSGASEVGEVLKESRGYSRHTSFWEAVHVTVVRGNFAQTLQLLQGANLEFAESAQHDGLGSTGYSGSHLHQANDAIRTAINLVRECPAVANEDWDIKDHDWNIFRQRVRQAYVALGDVAEGESMSRHSVSQPFQASHFGISQTQASYQLSMVSRKAESKVPWTVYENLKTLYQLMLGNENEILTISADWIEAVLGLSVWWDGEEEEEEEPAQGSLAASRRSLMRSQKVRSVDVTPVKAYSQRLSAALAAVIENSDDEFSINSIDRFEVGLACIFDGNIEGVLHIIRGWSLTLASAVAELASAGGWFTRANGLMGQFDQSDLMVLSYTERQPKGVSKDDLQISYANFLASKNQFKDQDGQTVREGWEMAIQLLGRLDDTYTANLRIERILNDLPLDCAARVDKITQLCYNMDLEKQALTISQKYADHLRTNTQNYGETLLYYSRAHNVSRIQEVLRVLVAHCLVKSVAYPPLDQLDHSLLSLITSPKQTLTDLANIDSHAASLLSNHLSGYATIRKFYDLRDEEVLLKDGEKPAHRPMARKRAAAQALMVVIASASSSIRGGLYDPSVETVVQVDILLPLLGEALMFINQPKRILTLAHIYTLLAAIEDLDTAPSMIRAQCETVLSTTLLAAHPSSSRPASQSQVLSKSILSMSQYSLISSTDLETLPDADAGADTDTNVNIDPSAVLLQGGGLGDAKRGWDWRRGFSGSTRGGDVLRVLRLGVAREAARAFAEGQV